MDVFYREGLQVPPQSARSAMGIDTGIPGGKYPHCPKRRKWETQLRRDRGGNELWEVEGTHSSLGKNPPVKLLGQEESLVRIVFLVFVNFVFEL